MSKFVHMELNTSDPEAAKKFYGSVFGWTYEDMPMPEGVYSMINTADGPLPGGLSQSPMPEVPSHWLGYILVDSVARTIEAVTDAGGSVIVPRTEVGGMGFLAVFSDPTGAVFGIWEAATPAVTAGDAEQTAAAEPAQGKKASKKKAAAKKAPAKKAAKKSAQAAAPAEQAAPAEAAPAQGKKASKKAAAKKAPAQGKKAAKKATAAQAPAASKKASKKAAKKSSAAQAPAASKKTGKKKASKKK